MRDHRRQKRQVGRAAAVAVAALGLVNHPALKDGACSGAIRCQPNPNGPVDQTKASKRR